MGSLLYGPLAKEIAPFGLEPWVTEIFAFQFVEDVSPFVLEH